MEKAVHRKKRIILYALLIMALFMGGIFSLGSRAVVSGKESYEDLRIFSEVLSKVQGNYVDEFQVKDLVYGAIKGMLQTLDPHSSFMTPDMYKEMQVDTQGKFEGIGIEISIRDGVLIIVSPIEGTPAFQMGLKSEDQILKIDDVSTRDMSLTEAAKRIKGPKGTKVTLTIMRKEFEKPKDFTVTRGIIKLASVSSKVIDKKIGYIRLRQFQENTATDMVKELKGMKIQELDGLILDERFNAGGLLSVAVDVADKFLPKGLVIVTTRGRGEEQTITFKSTHDPLIPKGMPMVVLVNAGSASASEIVAGALQDWGRAVLVGTKTFGKGSVQTIYPLSDGSALRLTTAKYYTPKGTSIHAKGITPDIVVENMRLEDKKMVISEEHAIREKDLVDMENRKKNLEPEGEEEAPPPEPQPDPNSPKTKEGDEAKYFEDLQLQRAIDIIKASKILEASKKL
ncbi:MAG: S41 family peptidase [bacterium]